MGKEYDRENDDKDVVIDDGIVWSVSSEDESRKCTQVQKR